jgi:hypothetical protein
MNNRKRTKARKIVYVTALTEVQTKFGPVKVKDPKSKRKVELYPDPNRPIKGEGLVYDKETHKWIPNPRLKK